MLWWDLRLGSYLGILADGLMMNAGGELIDSGGV